MGKNPLKSAADDLPPGAVESKATAVSQEHTESQWAYSRYSAPSALKPSP